MAAVRYDKTMISLRCLRVLVGLLCAGVPTLAGGERNGIGNQRQRSGEQANWQTIVRALQR